MSHAVGPTHGVQFGNEPSFPEAVDVWVLVEVG